MQERQQQHALANTPMCVTSEVCMYVGAVYCCNNSGEAKSENYRPTID